ncbi:MAG: aspartate aminotransferase family protein [Planctomycetaceae bacterium]
MAVGESRSGIIDSHLDATPRSRVAHERSVAVMPGGAKGAYHYAPYPVFFESGDGCRLVDVDGRTLVDFANHHTAQILGHRHPAVMAAIEAQLKRGVVLGGPTGVETELAEELCDRVESLERVRFCNSGTEATLHAIRLARGFTGRPKIAKFEGGYHGSHDAVEISVAPPLGEAGDPLAPTAVPGVAGMAPAAAEDVVILPYGDIDAVTGIVESHAAELACILLDPKAGMLAPVDGFAVAVSELAREHEILLIADEVVAFRLARGGWQQTVGVTPDLTTFGKLVGGGFPIGAFGGRADLMDRLDTRAGPTGFFQSGTFSAHPVAMAAGLATLRQLTPEAFERLDRMGRQLESGLAAVFGRHEISLTCVVAGSLFSLYFLPESPRCYRDLVAGERHWNAPVFHSLLQQGYFLSHSLAMNALSLPMESSDVDGLIAAVDSSLERVLSDGER